MFRVPSHEKIQVGIPIFRLIFNNGGLAAFRWLMLGNASYFLIQSGLLRTLKWEKNEKLNSKVGNIERINEYDDLAMMTNLRHTALQSAHCTYKATNLF